MRDPGLNAFPMIYIIAFLFYSGGLHGGESSAELTTVDSVELSRYTGTWYEIAKIPNRFQRGCAKNTTANYQLMEDGRIRVINECITPEGRRDRAEGIAKVVNTGTNAKLQVSFVQVLGLSLFWGDYWIIGLDEEYRWAIVGSPSRKYGWILSREPEIDESTLNKIYDILQEKGYDPARFEMTPQTGKE